MRGFTSLLWPIRYKPHPHELLSCWLLRLARGHGLKVQTFSNLICGERFQVWNRDIDRLAPQWFVDELAMRTGTSGDTANACTLRAYEGRLVRRIRPAGAVQWIQTMGMYHRTRWGFGLQFCSACLTEDAEPYFRTEWRVSFNTMCARHGCMLRDRCPVCGTAVAFHRLDMGVGAQPRGDVLSTCFTCGYDLRDARLQSVVSYDAQASAWHLGLCTALQNEERTAGAQLPPLDVFDVAHQLCSWLTSRLKTVRLREHVAATIGVAEIPLKPGRVPFETRSLAERHHLFQLVAWLMVDLEPRLRDAWRSKAIRYNHLKKDFESAPAWYLRLVEEFSDWRYSRR